MSDNTRIWMRPDDVMRFFGANGRKISRRTLYRLIDSGRLRAKDMGRNGRRRYIFHPSYLDEFRDARD